MSKSIDLGKTLKNIVSIEPLKPDEPHYPDLCIDSDDPRMANLPDKGECMIRYRVVSRTHREEGKNGKKERSCMLRLEITSITPPEKAKKRNGYGDDARKSFSDYFDKK